MMFVEEQFIFFIFIIEYSISLEEKTPLKEMRTSYKYHSTKADDEFLFSSRLVKEGILNK